MIHMMPAANILNPAQAENLKSSKKVSPACCGCRKNNIFINPPYRRLSFMYSIAHLALFH
jgi:hypothetical protein